MCLQQVQMLKLKQQVRKKITSTAPSTAATISHARLSISKKGGTWKQLLEYIPFHSSWQKIKVSVFNLWNSNPMIGSELWPKGHRRFNTCFWVIISPSCHLSTWPGSLDMIINVYSSRRLQHPLSWRAVSLAYEKKSVDSSTLSPTLERVVLVIVFR